MKLGEILLQIKYGSVCAGDIREVDAYQDLYYGKLYEVISVHPLENTCKIKLVGSPYKRIWTIHSVANHKLIKVQIKYNNSM